MAILSKWDAIKKVLNGLSITQAANFAGISRETLRKSVHKFCRDNNPSAYKKAGSIKELRANKDAFLYKEIKNKEYSPKIDKLQRDLNESFKVNGALLLQIQRQRKHILVLEEKLENQAQQIVDLAEQVNSYSMHQVC